MSISPSASSSSLVSERSEALTAGVAEAGVFVLPIVLPDMVRLWALLLRVAVGEELLLLEAVAVVVALRLEWPLLCVRSCCFMLSLRVNALWHFGQWTFFSPVCFFP